MNKTNNPLRRIITRIVIVDYKELLEWLRDPYQYEKQIANAIKSLLAENERLNHNLTTTEQTMREYQELAAKRLEEIERLKEIKMAGEIMRDLLKQRDELLKEAERHLLTFKRCELIDAANTEMTNIELERLGMKEAA